MLPSVRESLASCERDFHMLYMCVCVQVCVLKSIAEIHTELRAGLTRLVNVMWQFCSLGKHKPKELCGVEKC